MSDEKRDEYPGPALTVDPRRQFGRVCLYGTRVPAEVIAQYVYADDPVDGVADAYDTTREQVLAACWWYVVNGDIGPARTKKARLWIAWAEEAALVLGGHRPGPLCDPDDFVAGESV